MKNKKKVQGPPFLRAHFPSKKKRKIEKKIHRIKYPCDIIDHMGMG